MKQPNVMKQTVKQPRPRIFPLFVMSFLALIWVTGTSGCRSSADGTSVPTQQPAPPEPPGPVEQPEPSELPEQPEPSETNGSCGGLQGLACESGEYCHHAPSQMCGAADQLGACRAIPEFCTEQYDPVCGCDDNTYSNSCKANAAGISVASAGPCAQR